MADGYRHNVEIASPEQRDKDPTKLLLIRERTKARTT